MEHQFTIISDAWIACTKDCEDHDLSKKLFIDLYNQYNQPMRHYHNLQHLKQMLIGSVTSMQPFNLALTLAILYHDYYVGPSLQLTNEERSANKAHDDLFALGFPRHVVETVCDLIILTEFHDTDQQLTQLEAEFLDLDMMILSSPQQHYDNYVSQISLECQQLFNFDRTIFNSFRLKWLEKMLLRDRIFYTRTNFHNDIAVRNLDLERQNLLKCN